MTNLRAAIARNRLLKPARKPKRRHEEGDFQVTAIAHLELILPAEAICTSIDHANAKSWAAGADRKRRGVLPGLPDILVTWSPNPTAHLVVVIWFECKARDGVLRTDQESFRDAALAQGQYWCAPKTLEDIEAALRQTPIPIKRVVLLPSGVSYVATRHP
jgi:hypothetical protein